MSYVLLILDLISVFISYGIEVHYSSEVSLFHMALLINDLFLLCSISFPGHSLFYVFIVFIMILETQYFSYQPISLLFNLIGVNLFLFIHYFLIFPCFISDKFGPLCVKNNL